MPGKSAAGCPTHWLTPGPSRTQATGTAFGEDALGTCQQLVRSESPSHRSFASSCPPAVIELLLHRGSSPCSGMHTAEPTAVHWQHTANGVTHDKRWMMEDAVYSCCPDLYGSARSNKEASGVKLPTAHLASARSHQSPDLISCPISESRDSDNRDSSRRLARALASH
jgi:hypothetical protein